MAINKIKDCSGSGNMGSAVASDPLIDKWERELGTIDGAKITNVSYSKEFAIRKEDFQWTQLVSGATEVIKNKLVPGTVVSLERADRPVTYTYGNRSKESQDFLVKELHEESVLMSPAKDGRVSDAETLFTYAELKKFVVTTTEQAEPKQQVDQLLPKGPYITVQGYYDQWE